MRIDRLVLLTFVLGCGAPAAGPKQAVTIPVEVAEIARTRVPEVVRSRAVLEPARQVAIVPEAGGVIREVPKGEGEPVKAGEVVLVVAGENYSGGVDQSRAGLEGARAAVLQAESRLEAARTQVERLRSLRAENAVTQAQLDEAEAAFRAARAGLEGAQAQTAAAEAGLRSAQRRLGDTVVRAPFDGFVVRQNLQAGDLVGPGSGQPVLVVVDINPLRVSASVGELDLGRVEAGQSVEVRLDAFPGAVFEATLDRVNPLVEPISRRARVRATLPNEGQRLKPGMAGELALTLGTREVLLVPLLALGSRSGDEATVWIVEDGAARALTVRLGARYGAEVDVLEGLEPGMQVVTWGRGRLSSGAKVDVRSAPEAERP